MPDFKVTVMPTFLFIKFVCFLHGLGKEYEDNVKRFSDESCDLNRQS